MLYKCQEHNIQLLLHRSVAFQDLREGGGLGGSVL